MTDKTKVGAITIIRDAQYDILRVEFATEKRKIYKRADGSEYVVVMKNKRDIFRDKGAEALPYYVEEKRFITAENPTEIVSEIMRKIRESAGK